MNYTKFNILTALLLIGILPAQAMRVKTRSRSQDFTDIKLAADIRENLECAKLQPLFGDACDEIFNPTIKKYAEQAQLNQTQEARSSSYKPTKKHIGIALAAGAAGLVGKRYKLHKRFIPESVLATIGTAKFIKGCLGTVATILILWKADRWLHARCRRDKENMEQEHIREINQLKNRMNAKLKALGQKFDQRTERLAQEIQVQDLKLGKVKEAQHEKTQAHQREVEKIKKAQKDFELQLERIAQVSDATLSVQESTVAVIEDLKKSFETYNAELAKAGEISTNQKEIIATITSLKATLPRLRDAVTHLHAVDKVKTPKRTWSDRLLGRNKPKKGAGPQAEAPKTAAEGQGDSKRGAAAKKENGEAATPTADASQGDSKRRADKA